MDETNIGVGNYQIVDGLKWPAMADPKNLYSMKTRKPEDGEVLLATYPKCGTTWAAQIIQLIYNKGVPPTVPVMKTIPFPDMFGIDSLEKIPKPTTCRTHLPFEYMPWSDNAKYIYVMRNPKDCCVSYYHFACSSMDFNDYFEIFANGDVSYGDYFDHVLGWYEQRDKPNVLLLTYESMKHDVKSAILKLAEFLGEGHLRVVTDETVMSNIMKYSSFAWMKENNKDISAMFGNPPKSEAEVDKLPLSDALKYMIKATIRMNKVEKPTGDLIRKGTIGDWKGLLTDDQRKRLDEKAQKMLTGTSFYEEWCNIDCV